MSNPTLTHKDIRDNYQRVIERIDKAAKIAGRNPGDIRMVIVTKNRSSDVIQAVIAAGSSDLGENYAEEAIPKIQSIGHHPGLNWHMIGHVQSRKALMICENFNYLHSLDSVKLAERLSRFLVELNKTLPIFLEFNVGGESSKSGWNIWRDENWQRILPDIEKIIALPKLNLLGMMTIPPYSVDPEVSRLYYRRLRKFQEFVIDHFQLPGLKELSMGMSIDFEVAIQEGSTWIRVGQLILGPRTE